jgi:probable phosphoglycerate mutase
MLMPRLLYIVRHGVTDWNQSKCIQGQLDIPLNDAGRSQAALAAERLASLGATALYSSDLLRAYETAQIIAQAVGLRIIQKPGLREMYFGAWQGLTVDEIRERDPELYAARRERPHDVPPPGGEVWRQFYQRSIKSIHDILLATDAERVIVATHSGVCTVLGLEALGLGYTGKRPFGNANCAIHTIAVEGDRWEALSLNDVSHLEELPLAATPGAKQTALLRRPN